MWSYYRYTTDTTKGLVAFMCYCNSLASRLTSCISSGLYLSFAMLLFRSCHALRDDQGIRYKPDFDFGVIFCFIQRDYI